MPPKKVSNQPNKKTVEKQKQKVIEDKTFGLKNKKGAKQQKFIDQVQKQVTFGNRSAKELDKAREEKENKKEQKKKDQEELVQLFKPVVELQKISKGVDPKSVLCAYFKQGTCTKGDRCRFSHDLNIERKAEKRSIYDGEKEDMSKWDQNKLEEVIDKRHGVRNKGLPPTTIICKFFLDAVENDKYGWFWECPNGDKCHYRHALPADYILKRDKKKMEEQKEEISLEELIEKEREALGPNQTRVTLQSFLAWKRKKREEKLKKVEEEKAKKEKDFKQGKNMGLSGRELFEFNPDYVREAQDDVEEGGDVYIRTDDGSENEDEDYKGPITEIDINDFYRIDEGIVADGTTTEEPAIDENLFNADDLEGLDDELESLTVE